MFPFDDTIMIYWICEVRHSRKIIHDTCWKVSICDLDCTENHDAFPTGHLPLKLDNLMNSWHKQTRKSQFWHKIYQAKHIKSNEHKIIPQYMRSESFIFKMTPISANAIFWHHTHLMGHVAHEPTQNSLSFIAIVIESRCNHPAIGQV